MSLETTLDGILNRRVSLEQPKSGYRVAVDTVLLAAAAPAYAGDHILDLGCGVGGAALALSCRVAGTTGVGIDIQSELVDLFRRNVARNAFAAGWTAQTGDVTVLPPDYHGVFNHVVANPPYHDQARHDVSANTIKYTANSFKNGDLRRWIAAAAKALKPEGILTLIHRADYQDEIMEYMRGSFAKIEILPICSKIDIDPKRIIIRAGSGQILSVHKAEPFILHRPDGGYTAVADAVLRDCASL